MPRKDQTQTLLQGTAILAFAALFTKIIGVLYRIPYQNITGDTGLYVYSQVYPIYMILLTVATAGIPIAVSKLVSERLAVGDAPGANRIFHGSALILTCTGILFFLLLFLGAPLIAYFWNNDQNLTLPIRSVAFALLIVPVMAAMRGYYQGHQNMLPTGISQVAEQIIRVTTILLGSYFLYDRYGAYFAGAAAVFGAFTGAVAALVVLLFFWKHMQRKQQELVFADPGPSGPESASETAFTSPTVHSSYADVPLRLIMKKVAAYAIPISLGSLVIPLFQLVDSATIPNVLSWMEWDPEAARQARGIFDRGQPLVQFGAFFATAMALALVPSISEAHARGDRALISRRTHLALKVTFVLGLAAACGLFVLAEPVNRMLYVNSNGVIMDYIPDYGTQAISVLAFVIIFTTLNVTSAAILQGVGQVMLPARHLLIGVLVKALGNVTLIPWLDITGAALASVIGYAVATALNLWSVQKITEAGFSRPFLLKPVLSTAVMVLGVWLAKEGMYAALAQVMPESRLYFTFISLMAVLIGMVVYLVALLKCGAITRRELVLIPKMRRFIPVFERLKMIKSEEEKEGSKHV